MKHEKIATFKFAVQKSLPVLFGYLFLGSAFGIMLYKAGYNWIWAVFISIVVYAGSGQFLLVSLISAKADIATTAICFTDYHILKNLKQAVGAILL